jgi:D-3-phosphoglycerate dehydrogenase
MKIFVACELPEGALESLRSLAVEVHYRPNATTAELREKLTGVGLLIVGSTRIAPDMIARAPELQMIIHAGSGPGDIALEAASQQGVFVTHCPDKHAAAVAELTFGLILALDRRIVENSTAMHEGRWIRGELTDARGLAGRTLGIVGWGATGRLVARLARAFNMRVLAWSPAMTPETSPDLAVEFCNWPRELARECDIVTVQAIEGELEPLIDADFLQSMREGAYLVHVGQAGTVDEVALARAVEERHLRLALDAFTADPAGETGRFRCRLCDLPGVIGTQHIAELTEQARLATADEVVRVVQAFVVSGEVENCLNLCDRSPATWQLVMRVRDQPGVMAAVLDVVRADGINAQEITSRVFTGAKAAWLIIALDERPSTEALDAIHALTNVLHLELRAVV